MPPRPPSRLPSWLVGGGVIAVAMGVMNLSTYGFTIVSAHRLGPRQYGALAALMGLLLILNVVSLGLQATAARRVSAAPAARADTELEVLAASYRAALGLGVLTLLATPLVASVLRLDTWLTGVLLAVATVPLTVMGGQAGLFQGERRWVPLAGIYLGVGLGRVGLGLLGVLLYPSTTGAMLGVAAGAFAPAVVGWWFLRHPGRRAGPPVLPCTPVRTRTRLSAEVAHNSHALLAFFALSNIDVLIARSVLPDHASGLYAGGLILTKAVLFLPQFVVIVAFPSMSEARGSGTVHGRGLVTVLAIGLGATLGAWLLSPLAIEFVGGDAYAELRPRIWAFAGIGTLLSLIQLMVYAVVARQSRRAVFVVWGGLVLLLCLVPAFGSVTSLLTTVAAVQAAVLAVLGVLAARRMVSAPPRASSAQSPPTRPTGR